MLAKQSRDATMVELDRSWPEYGFARHKGYPTPQHRAALLKHGACPEHRRSYAPVRAAIEAVGERPESAAADRLERGLVVSDDNG